MSVQSDLEVFAALLRKWNAAQNLVSRETIDELWPRHIDDSLQLLPLLRPADRDIIDLGSGGGFPAIPLAIACRGQKRRFTLVEPIIKKAAFLRTATRELKLSAIVEGKRAEQIDSRETFDLVTSRALAALSQVVGLGLPLLRPGGHMLLHKGRNFREELASASALYDLDVIVHPSQTDPVSAIVEIRKPGLETTV